MENGGLGSLQVDTSHRRPGYLRRNGVPFSEETYMTEYFSLLTGAGGEEFLADPNGIVSPGRGEVWPDVYG